MTSVDSIVLKFATEHYSTLVQYLQDTETSREDRSSLLSDVILDTYEHTVIKRTTLLKRVSSFLCLLERLTKRGRDTVLTTDVHYEHGQWVYSPEAQQRTVSSVVP